MEEPRWDAELRTPELAAPILPENRPFAASFPEKICAFVMYLLAFCYIQMIFSPTLHAVWLCVFCAGFVSMAEVLFRARRRSWESWVWLSCMLVIVGSLVWREVQYVPMTRAAARVPPRLNPPLRTRLRFSFCTPTRFTGRFAERMPCLAARAVICWRSTRWTA